MNDFREFSQQYNDYICHAASTGHMTKKGDKNLISTEDPKEPPKHYAYRLAQSGWTIDQVKQLCERSSNAYDSPANHKYWAEVLRIFKENYVQHSCNDFRQFSEQYKDYLMHFGILGMKWGVRRYQNQDGTLTAAGKARYDKLKTKSDEYYKKAENKKSIDEVIEKDRKTNGPDWQYYRQGDYLRAYNAKKGYDGIVRGEGGVPYKISELDKTGNAKKGYDLKKKAEKYGKETPVEKAGRQITNYVNFEKENGFKKADWDPNVSVKTATVKDSNGKNKKIDFCIDFDTDLEKIGDNSKDVKNTFDDFEKYYRQHEAEIKRQAKEQILGKIKEHNLGPEDTEYFTKMANNIGNKGFMQVRYQAPDQVTIDIDDGVDDLFQPSMDYDVNEQKVRYIRMND